MRSKADEMGRIAAEVEKCRKCPLWRSRRKPVLGEGPLDAKIMFFGEAPGRVEDETGRPFVGPAGKLLDSLLADVGLSRESVYITNVVKCRPPGNRDPREEEIRSCAPYLERQVMVIKPRIIVALGRHSAKWFASRLGIPFRSIMSFRGRVYESRFGNPLFGEFFKVYFIATLHPAAALYNPGYRSIIRGDLLRVAELCGELCG